ncbi:hypothetical protein BO85DRAFT_467954 [Aspergillus piperis CBS 112811]|uniref:Actin-like ATPase domain-containing protein n=1 Tax=Aspergillus piperis CBS 112811 TaxID=1448313 RepID=A0A8G1R500_9EURO|nr:hypothetical protein BO85DRAFT_467954 [Aspergillus piperis CBS 112811]RAH59297.1 hypothetical protein BO85DRAFT_467954 [Aspergillus piperis CBS 112811]
MEERIRNNIVVSVDCGTTHSGVSWMHPEAEDDVQSVDKWPGRPPADTLTRVPTRIAYQDENDSLDKTKAWGYEVGAEHVAASWTKLLLEPGVEEEIVENSDNKGWVASVGIFTRPGGRDPTRIIQDFLQLLRKHAEAQIRKKYKELGYAILPFVYVYTVPATWSDTAITALKQAASKAGCRGIGGSIYPLIISEPEAALTTMINDPRSGIKAGDGVAICDCGGGTLCPIPVHFHGGSMEIDRDFYTAASKGLIRRFSQLKRSETSPTSTLMIGFENAKREFEGTVGPDLQELTYTRRGNVYSFKFTSVDMLRLQAPVVTKICSVLEDIISQGHRKSGAPIVKHIYVSGAMARSIYLRSAIDKLFAESQIETHYPSSPQNAVAEGAALWGYNRLRLNTPYPFGEPIGEKQRTVFPCRVSQDLPFSVIKIYDSDKSNPPQSTDPKKGVRNIGRLLCDFTEALRTSKVSIGEIVQIEVSFIIKDGMIHVKAESRGVLFGEMELKCFY